MLRTDPRPDFDDPEYIRQKRIAQYTYSPLQRIVQRVRGILAAVVPGQLGYDLSAWQLLVNFEVSKAAGLLWLYIRAVYGVTVDVKFPQHFKGSKGVIKRVCYLYYKDNLDPQAQAVKLYTTCVAQGDPGDFMPVFDLETINNPTLTASKVKICLEEITLLFGKKPLIYSGYYVIRDALKGDKSFLSAYSLIIGAYPFAGWTDDLPQKVLQYPPLIPAPFQMWTSNADESLTGWVVGWQFTAQAPAEKYGVSGNTLDLDWCSPAFAKQVLGDVPPAPPPLGEKLLFTNPKLINIRSSPATTGTNDVGDLPAGSIIAALEVRATDNNSVWVRFTPDPTWIKQSVPEYWVAIIHDNQGILLNWQAQS